MKVFQWYDVLIVAQSKADARSLLLGIASASEIRRGGSVSEVQGKISLTNDHGETFHSYTPADVVEMCGRGIIPEAG